MDIISDSDGKRRAHPGHIKGIGIRQEGDRDCVGSGEVADGLADSLDRCQPEMQVLLDQQGDDFAVGIAL